MRACIYIYYLYLYPSTDYTCRIASSTPLGPLGPPLPPLVRPKRIQSSRGFSTGRGSRTSRPSEASAWRTGRRDHVGRFGVSVKGGEVNNKIMGDLMEDSDPNISL